MLAAGRPFAGRRTQSLREPPSVMWCVLFHHELSVADSEDAFLDDIKFELCMEIV